MHYSITSYTNATTTAWTPWSITIYRAPSWSSNNDPQSYPERFNRQLRRLNYMIEQFGKKVALARHENIMWARRLIAEQDWWLRRIGTPVLAGLPRLVQRRGRVCGESNYYRAMLC